MTTTVEVKAMSVECFNKPADDCTHNINIIIQQIYKLLRKQNRNGISPVVHNARTHNTLMDLPHQRLDSLTVLMIQL